MQSNSEISTTEQFKEKMRAETKTSIIKGQHYSRQNKHYMEEEVMK